MSYTTEIAALKEKITQDQTGILPAGRQVPLNVAENLNTMADIIEGIGDAAASGGFSNVALDDETIDTDQHNTIQTTPSGTVVSVDKDGVEQVLSEPITIPGTVLASDTYRINGGEIVWIENYDFRVSKVTFKLLGIDYTAEADTVTLTNGGGDPRIDVIYADTSGNIGRIQGQVDTNPIKPSVDPTYQIELGFIFVAGGGSTQPANAVNYPLYTEDLGSGGGEWDLYVASPSVNSASTNSPKTGTYCIEGTNVPVSDYLMDLWPGDDPVPITDADQKLVLNILSKGSWGSGKNAKRLVLIWEDWDSADYIGTPVTILARGTYGFDSSDTSSYQQIAIPIKDFNLPVGYSNVGGFAVMVQGSSGTMGWHIDDIYMNGTGQLPVGNANSGFTNVDLADEDVDLNQANTIQTTPLGVQYAVDKNGKSATLGGGSSGGGSTFAVVTTDSVQGQVPGTDLAFKTAPGMAFVIPADKAVEVICHFPIGGASTNFQFKTLWTLTGGLNNSDLELNLTYEVLYQGQTVPVSVNHDYYLSPYTEIDWSAVTGFGTPGTFLLRITGFVLNKNLTEAGTLQFSFYCEEGYGSAKYSMANPYIKTTEFDFHHPH